MSDAEAALAFQIKALGLPKPVTEFRFHTERRWRFDFAWPDRSVAVEVEGGSWSSGRHTRPLGFEMDCVKYNEAALLGWRVLRVTPNMIEDGRAITYLERALA